MFDPEKAINKILGLKGIIREKYNSRKLKQKVLYLHQPKVIDEEFDTELVELNVIVTKNDIKKYSNFSDAIIAAVKKKIFFNLFIINSTNCYRNNFKGR